MKIECYKVYELALLSLGYENENVSVKDKIDIRQVNIVNGVYTEVFFKMANEGFAPLTDAYSEIELPEKVVYTVLVPGVAEKIAFEYADANLQAYFAGVYNNGLHSLNSFDTQISDVLPSDYMND